MISFSVGSGIGPETAAPFLFGGFYNFFRCRIDQRMVVAFQSDSDFFADCHLILPP